MDREYKAATLFYEGYNCAQAVAMAFSDVIGLEEKFCTKAVSSFGSGMGRLREVCGAVSSMMFVAGILYGYDTKDDDGIKKEHYARVQELAGKFRDEVGSRNILRLSEICGIHRRDGMDDADLAGLCHILDVGLVVIVEEAAVIGRKLSQHLAGGGMGLACVQTGIVVDHAHGLAVFVPGTLRLESGVCRANQKILGQGKSNIIGSLHP